MVARMDFGNYELKIDRVEKMDKLKPKTARHCNHQIVGRAMGFQLNNFKIDSDFFMTETQRHIVYVLDSYR